VNYLAELYICITACLQIIRIYAQSVLCIQRHNCLDTMPLPDSRINEINDRLIK